MNIQKECCMNPWNGVCESTDIVVYILYKGRPRPICRRCWEEIAEEDFEWGVESLED